MPGKKGHLLDQCLATRTCRHNGQLATKFTKKRKLKKEKEKNHRWQSSIYCYKSRVQLKYQISQKGSYGQLKFGDNVDKAFLCQDIIVKMQHKLAQICYLIKQLSTFLVHK
jgi:hypothetical protein